MKKIAIVQSNYIPWKGYFDLIASVDEVILYDDMQYTRRDWRNRNKIKTPHGLKWLTVPVQVKGKYHQKICETELDGTKWSELHWRTIVGSYKRSSFFSEVSVWLEPIYLDGEFSYLSDLNRRLIEAVCLYLEINTQIGSSMNYNLVDGKTERLVDLCLQAGGNEYLSGPAARDYIDEEAFNDAGVHLSWMDYSDYPEYPQLWGEFCHEVSILDVLFNCGRDARQYMKCVKS